MGEAPFLSQIREDDDDDDDDDDGTIFPAVSSSNPNAKSQQR
jgi:hypothetical protein